MATRAGFISVVDLETSGTNEHRHEILQVGRVVVDVARKIVLPELSYSSYVRTSKLDWSHRDPEAMLVNKIKFEQVREAPEGREVLERLMAGLSWGETVIGSWGIDFELKFLQQLYDGYDWPYQVPHYGYKGVDIRSAAFMPLAAGGILDYPNLKEACGWYNVKCEPAKMHDALYDAQLEAAILIELLHRETGRNKGESHA